MIRTVLFLTGLSLTNFSARAQNNDAIMVSTPVKSVILYLDGAEVTQNKQVPLNAGRTLVTFTGLSPKLIPKSIQVNVGSELLVLSVTDKINFLTGQKDSPRVKQLKDSVDVIMDNLAQLNYEFSAYSEEKAMLNKNESIGGHEKGVNVADLKLAVDYYRARLKDINTETFKVQKKIEKNNEIMEKLQLELAEQNGNEKLPTAEISILISSNAKTTANIDLKYVVKESGWTPSYDLITEDINKPIELKYRAKVYNNSGVSWDDVKIKLSTADPMQSASKPELAAWYLNFSTAGYYSNAYNGNAVY
ncbi:MAG: mucoidy inhibitor MuiA family protein, partial [Bacteroidia bacterium]